MKKRICSLLLCAMLCVTNSSGVYALSGADSARLKMNEVWKFTTGKGVNAAVLDSGANLKDSAISRNIKGVYNAVTGSEKPEDVDTGTSSHGTSCAKALVEAAPEVNLYIIKVSDKKGFIYDSAVEKALKWAYSKKCRVISMSFGGESVPKYADVVEELYKAPSNSALVCASGGNEGKFEYHYPASLDHTLSVAAAKYSVSEKKYMTVPKGSYCDKMDVAAPGGASSSAAAFAAGTAALLFQADPSLTASECHSILKETALDLGARGKDYYSGYGLIQPYKAIEKILNIKPVSNSGEKHARSLKLSKKKMIIRAGASKKLTCRQNPSGSKDKIKWSSSRPSVAKVDSRGRVKAKKAGTAVITARTSRGVKASCKVTVRPRR